MPFSFPGACPSSLLFFFWARQCTSLSSLSLHNCAMWLRPIASKQSLASLNDIVFGLFGPVLFSLCIEDSWGGLIAIVLLAAGGFVAGVVGDRPLPPGWVPGVASQALSAAAFALITFNPSNICADTFFCFVSATVQVMCL